MINNELWRANFYISIVIIALTGLKFLTLLFILGRYYNNPMQYLAVIKRQPRDINA